ncbi:MAG: LTA synthase family protein [Roseburia sp.]|nr:LTA synthase family protein [Roseburia sp.]
MKITVEITKKKIVFTGIVALISVLAHFLAGISIFNMFLFPVLYFGAIAFEIELKKKWNWAFVVPVFAVSSYVTTWTVQYLLLEEDLRGKISEDKFLLNMLCCLFCYMFVQTITNNTALTCTIAHITLLVFAGVNYFVYGFRGNEITFGDIKSLSTGLSVASNYHFSLNAQAMNAILFTVVWIAGIKKIHIQFKKEWMIRILSASVAVFAFVYVGLQSVNTVTETWEKKGTYRNGYLLNFALSIRDSFVEKPERYSDQAVTAIESAYADTKDTGSDSKKPTIIAIMDESFADLGAMGNLETNQEVMPFISSLTENAVYGKAIASVYGAKTPNSEWEFLTGNSMAWLPSGSVAYQQYLTENNAYSVVDTLKDQGYTCVAMHPYYETGWSRDLVYPLFGFDEMYFLDDFDQTNLMRKYVSDETMFDQIIERYEAGGDKENLFLMGVTMQNHGGYTDSYDNFVTDTFSTNIPYPDVNQYLTLAHQTDQAVEKLISYFNNVDKPVVVCFFGDHQPSLNTAFYRALNGKGLSGLTLAELEELYEVPFFIWTNYASESRHLEHTSLNFLSTMVLQQAGLELPAYHQFLADLMEAVPAMNVRAFFSNSYNRYFHYEDAVGEDAAWLEKYQILQYNGLFQKKNKSELFFGR